MWPQNISWQKQNKCKIKICSTSKNKIKVKDYLGAKASNIQPKFDNPSNNFSTSRDLVHCRYTT